jgi:hypothetical protein
MDSHAHPKPTDGLTPAGIIPALSPNENIVLPRYIQLQSTLENTRHIRFVDSGLLQATTDDPKENTRFRFEVIELGDGWVQLQTSNGEIVKQVTKESDKRFKCLAVDLDTYRFKGMLSDVQFKFILLADDFVQIRVNGKFGSGYVTPIAADDDICGVLFRRQVLRVLPGQPSFTAKFKLVSLSFKTEITDIKYKLPDAAAVAAQFAENKLEPLVVYEKNVDSSETRDGTVKQVVSFDYEISTKRTWTDKKGKTFTTSCKFNSVGLKFMPDLTITETKMAQHEWGDTNGESSTESFSTEVTVRPGGNVKVNAWVRQCMLEVEFSYKQTVHWNDGKIETYDRIGVYRSLEGYRVDVKTVDIVSDAGIGIFNGLVSAIKALCCNIFKP